MSNKASESLATTQPTVNVAESTRRLKMRISAAEAYRIFLSTLHSSISTSTVSETTNALFATCSFFNNVFDTLDLHYPLGAVGSGSNGNLAQFVLGLPPLQSVTAENQELLAAFRRWIREVAVQELGREI